MEHIAFNLSHIGTLTTGILTMLGMYTLKNLPLQGLRVLTISPKELEMEQTIPLMDVYSILTMDLPSLPTEGRLQWLFKVALVVLWGKTLTM